MDLEEQQKRVIAEQREQLMQLREQLKKSKGENRLTTGELHELLSGFKVQALGKTIGFIVPDSMRERLLVQIEGLKAKSYRQMILTCVELGLRQLEGRDVGHSVETVQGVLGSDNPGDGADSPANDQAGVSRGTGVLADN